MAWVVVFGDAEIQDGEAVSRPRNQRESRGSSQEQKTFFLGLFITSASKVEVGKPGLHRYFI